MDTLLSNKEGFLILLYWLISHILIDFVFQKIRLVYKKKWLSFSLFFHAGLMFLVFGIVSSEWFYSLILTLIHFFIDCIVIKIRQWGKISASRLFLFHHVAHIVSIVIIWSFCLKKWKYLHELLVWAFTDIQFLLMVLSYLTIIFPVGYLVGLATRNYAG